MRIIPSTFTKFELTHAEQCLGEVFSSLNLAVIKNLRCSIAEQKLNLIFNPDNLIDFAQQTAFLQGQLDILQHLVDCSEAASSPQIDPNS